MSTSKRAAATIAMFAVLTICTVVAAQQRPAPPKGPGLGVPATPAEIASCRYQHSSRRRRIA